jgi:4'-phosphopantetheinyl transferase
MIALTSDEIHLWLAFYDEIQDERLHSTYRAILTDAERQQQLRFLFARDQLRYLVTRALVRTVLARYAPIAPEHWTFATNSYGRPYIANCDAAAADLHFNVSHTHSLIVLGLTRGGELGVDVENVRDRAAPIDIADRFFAPAEVAALAQVRADERHDRFFEYWTFKESYIKARGMGLSLPLDKFSFHFPSPQKVILATDPQLADDPAQWQFWQFRPTPAYLLATCARRMESQQRRVVVRRVVPIVGDELIAPLLLRRSE